MEIRYHRRIQRFVCLVLTLFVLLGYYPQTVEGNIYYSEVKQDYTTVTPSPVILEKGTVGTSVIFMNSTSARTSISSDNVSSDVEVSSSSGSYGFAYSTQRRIVRTADPDNTIHVFLMDTSGYLQWYKSTDDGQSFFQYLGNGPQATDLSVAKDSNNNIHLVYTNDGIHYLKLAYNAGSWDDFSRDITSPDKEVHYPTIAVAPYDENWLYIVYDLHSTKGQKQNEWHFTYSTDEGATWSSSFEGTLNEYETDFTAGTFPSIVIDNTLDTYGHVYVTWFSGNNDLYLRRGVIGSTGDVTWDSSANTISSSMSSASTVVNTNMMHSAVYVNSKYRIVYCESGTAKYRDWNETTWTTPISLATVSHYPSLTYDDNNNLYVFYETNIANPNYDIRYQKSVDKTPTGFGSAVTVTNDDSGNHRVMTRTGQGRIEFIRIKGTMSPFLMEFCYLETDSDYVLKIVNEVSDPWKIRLSAYSENNLNRLDNCTIYFYNGGISSQIVVIDGSYSTQEGTWYDLASSGTDYIAMHIEASAGLSQIYVYLETLIPDTTTYIRYILTFEIS